MTSGAQAVKLEGVDGHEKVIERIVGSGVPVMGHIGLTPQSVNEFGGFKVQEGTTPTPRISSVRRTPLEDLGCFSIVIEMCAGGTRGPHHVGAARSHHRHRGGSATTDRCSCCRTCGEWTPATRRVSSGGYIDGESVLTNALNQYDEDVKEARFPGPRRATRDDHCRDSLRVA